MKPNGQVEETGVMAKSNKVVSFNMEKIIEAFRQGQLLVVTDDEDRENEGDLILAADFITPAAINFMATHARGLICVAITDQRASQLGLVPMVSNNECPHGTAFTISVDAGPQHGVTTGISAYDRAKTIELITHGNASDLCKPGHVFPLVAKPGGVLQRQGHTEAAVDLAILAGLAPAGVIVEIMNEDGTMARRAELEKFAELHGLLMINIAEIYKFREKNQPNYNLVAAQNGAFS